MDSGQIPSIALPSGGTVDFIDLDDVSYWDVQQIRKVLDAKDTAGETTNRLFIEAMKLGIKAWKIPYLAVPEHTLRENPGAWKFLKARDGQAIEAALQPVLELLKPIEAPDPGDSTPGSPTQPGSE